MSEERPPDRRPVLTVKRVLIWIVVGGIGIYLFVTGLVGVLAKG